MTYVSSNHEKHKKFSGFPPPPSAKWTNTEKSAPSEHMQDNAFTMFSPILRKTVHKWYRFIHRRRFLSVIVEFRRGIKKKTSRGKRNTLDTCIRPTQLLKTLGLVSTLNERDCVTFWNSRIAENSTNLWLPTRTDFVASASNSLNTFSTPKVMQKSWFSTIQNCHPKKKSLKTCSTFCTSSVPDVTESESTVERCRKIRLFPTPAQRKVLKQWVGGYRYFYNKTHQYVQDNLKCTFKEHKDGNYILFEGEYLKVQRWGTHRKVYNLPGKYKLRDIIKKNMTEAWAKELPSHLINEAVYEYHTRFVTNFKQGKVFKMKKKSKHRLVRETFNFDDGAFSKDENCIYPTFLRRAHAETHFKCNELFVHYEKKGSSITYHRRLGTYTLNFSILTKVKNTPNTDTIALDPGVKRFMVGFSPHEVISFGTDASKKLEASCRKLDKIQSRIDTVGKTNHLRRQRLRRLKHRQIRRIQDKIAELHWKVSNYLTMNYGCILLPTFRSQQMVGKLHSKVARSMYTLSFYQFEKRLESKCEERGVSLIRGSEAYTSKTCTRCGVLNTCKDRDYDCKSCGLSIDRDVNGARNIYLRLGVTST